LKHIIAVAAVLFALAAFTPGKALPRATEITLIEPVLALGFDKGEITFMFEDNTQSTHGASPAAALEAMKKQHPREVAVSAADFFLFGRNADISGLAEFILKAQPLRLTASVFIVQGSANSATAVLAEREALDILKNFGENSGTGAYSSLMPFYEFMSELSVPGRSFAAPALNSEGVPDGYAVIKNGEVAGFLSPPASRGYNIIKNKSVYSVVGGARLKTAKSKISFDFDSVSDELVCININVEISVSETGEAEGIIYEEIAQVIALSKRLESDFAGFGDLLRLKHPYRFERMKADWDDIYAQTPVKINVTGRAD